MSYTGLELFIEKLKQLIYNDDYPLIRNHLPSISPVRPLLKRLYQELHSTIRILFTEKENYLHEVEEVRNLQKRFKEVAEEAHDRIDLFVSVINFKHKKLFPFRSDFELSLNLRDIMGSIKSIKTFSNVKMVSSLKTQSPVPAGASCTRNSLRSNKQWDENIVGLDHDIELIRDKLVEDRKRLDVVSIVGTGGIGKTTLATKVFNDPYVVHHFNVRAWVTVSQTYEKHDLLIKILASIGIEVDSEKAVHSKLREMLHKRLMGKRFLVVIDDIWDTKAWDDLKAFFPNDNNQSRILLTSRLKEVALHAKPDGLIHWLEYLTDKESWEFLRKKVFHGHDCPESLFEPGMQIAKACRGLPLTLVVIAGVLAQEATSKHSWERIAQNVASYVFKDPNRYLETLALSVNHLPFHLRDCFLYLGGFPEDYEFRPRRLIWLWIAEGFIQETGKQSLEEIAKGYLMELLDRNLVVVKSRKFNGAIKTFFVHDVLRELCFEIATKENFFLNKQGFDNFMVATYMTRRIFTDRFVDINDATRTRSLLYFNRSPRVNGRISMSYNSWMLLMVLDLQQYRLSWFPAQIALLVHLRYLAIRFHDEGLPFTICNLRSLQTLIIERDSHPPLFLPNTISNLVSLRHLWIQGGIVFPPFQKPMNLQTISNIVILGDGPKSWVKYFPGVKKLSCFTYSYREYDFKLLNCLEILRITSPGLRIRSITFPVSLKKLTLKGCRLPWFCISKIQSLPKLEVLVLLDNAFIGFRWDAGEEPFQQLKSLKFHRLDIREWEASSINFPCLKQLVLNECDYLEEIPPEIGYIPTLERIEIDSCRRPSVTKSVLNIQAEQHADGNFDTVIIVDGQKINNISDIFLDHWYRWGKGNIELHGGSLRNAFRDHWYRWGNEIIELHGGVQAVLLNREVPLLGVLTNHPTFSPASHHMRNSRRIWNNHRSKRRRVRRKFSNRDGGLRLLQY